MQRQDTALKQGVNDELKLTLLDEKNEGKQTVSGWIDEIKSLLEMNGMDTVFRIWDTGYDEEYLLSNWGNANLSKVQNWVSMLQNGMGDSYDIQNLRLSAVLIRNSISIAVAQQIASTHSLSQ